MSLAIVEELARRFRAGELDAAFELYHPQIRIEQPASLPHGGVHTGHAAVREMGARFAKHWTRTISEPYRTSCADGCVLQITQQTWTAITTSKSATVDVIELITFEENTINAIRVFQQDTHLLMATLEGLSNS